MGPEFNKKSPATSSVSQDDFEYALACQVLSEHKGEKPHFVTVISWFALHEYNHDDGELDVEFVKANNLIDDFWYRDDKQYFAQVFGFRDDPCGVESLHIIEGWLGPKTVWTLDANGKLVVLDQNSLGHNSYLIDFNNPMSRANAIYAATVNAFRHVLTTQRIEKAAAIEAEDQQAQGQQPKGAGLGDDFDVPF